jgi:hypothetical protein
VCVVLARSVSVISVLVVCSFRPSRCGPCLPFYSFQGKGSCYICGKKLKWEKDEREKQKRWPRVWPSSSLSGMSSFPCSAKMQWALIFWPLHLLVQYVVVMLRPVCFHAIEDGWYRPLDSHREGVGGIVVVTPVAVEVWMLSWWNDRGRVGLERGSHGPVHCARSCPSHRWE